MNTDLRHLISFTFLILNSACADVDHSSYKPYSKPAQWDTVCLGRHLIDLPEKIEFGASKPAYAPHGNKLVYYIEGINGSGTGTQSVYSETEFAETYTLSKNAFSAIKVDAQQTYEGFKKDHEDNQRISQASRVGPVKLDSQKNYFAFKSSVGDVDFGIFDEATGRAILFHSNLGSEADVETIRWHVAQLIAKYRPREKTELPALRGICTPYGFFVDNDGEPAPFYSISLSFRSQKYPNLIFVMQIEPHSGKGPADVDKLDNPNAISLKNLNVAVLAAVAGVKRSFGPERIDFAGQKGRLYGREYHPSETGGGAAYEMVAEVVGVPGDQSKPKITLTMAAALADRAPNPPLRNTFTKEIIPWESTRPRLQGHEPPPFEEGMQVFKQVLASIRPRPGAVQTSEAAQPIGR